MTSSSTPTDNREAVALALKAYGSDLRNDWSEFDGRSAKYMLDNLASYLTDDAEPVTWEDLAAVYEFCPVERTRYRWCSKADPDYPYDLCGHIPREDEDGDETPQAAEVVESD